MATRKPQTRVSAFFSDLSTLHSDLGANAGCGSRAKQKPERIVECDEEQGQGWAELYNSMRAARLPAPRSEMVHAMVADRRRTHRHNLRIPLHVCIRGSVDQEQLAESVDISERGVLVETDLPLRVGLVVDVRMKFLREITGQRTTEWHCRGRVVRIARSTGEAQALRVGVRFDQLGVLRVEGC